MRKLWKNKSILQCIIAAGILPAICCFFISCHKKQLSYSISGIVFNPNTNSGVEGVAVSISAKEISGSTYNNNAVVIANATTDAGGGFSFEFDKGSATQYFIDASKTDFFDATDSLLPEEMSLSHTNPVILKMYSKSWVKIRFKNDFPRSPSDVFTYNNLDANDPCGCCDNNKIVLIGAGADSTQICIVYGDRYLHYSWTLVDNNGTSAHSDSIQCLPGDTTYYELFY